jgi:hypothetical protein
MEFLICYIEINSKGPISQHAYERKTDTRTKHKKLIPVPTELQHKSLKKNIDGFTDWINSRGTCNLRTESGGNAGERKGA